MKSHLPSFMLGSNMRIKYGSAHCDNVFLYGNHFGTLTPVFLNLFGADAVYTAKTTVIPKSSTVYFVALAFHLIQTY